MKNHARRVVAIISASIINKKQYSSVYDYKESKYYNISCEITSGNINSYDYELKCYITGSGNGSNISLYHYGNDKYIDLNINRAHFEGYDYDSSKHYSGDVNGDSISIYDYELQQYFNYSV